jgi:hypothetical protein
VQRIGIAVGEEVRESLGQLLVEEQAHVGLRGGDAQRPALALRGIRQTRTDVVMRQLREIREQFRFRHPTGQIAEHIPTVMRVPRTHGFPKRTLGSMVMRSSTDMPSV